MKKELTPLETLQVLAVSARDAFEKLKKEIGK